MTAIDPRLLDEIRRGNCVAFVGAGFSAAAGLPSWPALLRVMADALPGDVSAGSRATIDRLLESPAHASNRELEMAAQLLFDALGEQQCRVLLRDALRKDALPPAMQRRLKHLFGIPFRAIVTTNFDPLIAGVAPDPAAYRRLPDAGRGDEARRCRGASRRRPAARPRDQPLGPRPGAGRRRERRGAAARGRGTPGGREGHAASTGACFSPPQGMPRTA
jgi:hypothetical protein